MTDLADKRVLLVGAGGLGSPAARTLVRSGVGRLTLLDDDTVDPSNLHRQTLYGEHDVGAPKGPAAARDLEREAARAGTRASIEVIEGRLLPHAAVDLCAAHDLVLEGADNFATKFLAADAAALAGVPVVQAGAVRWSGWALASVPGDSACLRCVFEDIPEGPAASCATAGVVGPVVGVMGALQAAMALRLMAGDTGAAGVLWSYRALEGALRPSRVRRRDGCPLCAGDIDDTRMERYTGPHCAA